MDMLSELDSRSSIVQRALRIKEYMSLKDAAISPTASRYMQHYLEQPQGRATQETNRFERRDKTELSWSKVDMSSIGEAAHVCTSQA